MEYNPEIHHRRSIRLQGYDYSLEGMYFVTICVQDRECLFGEIDNGEMRLSEMGRIAYDEWMHTPEIRKNVVLGSFVVMPNHVHGIIIINNTIGRRELHSPDLSDDRGEGACDKGVCDTPRHRLNSPSHTFGAIVRGYKSSVTKKICELLNTNKLVVWQRNYWEHIIRDDQSYHVISKYITNNPKKWDADKLR